MSSHPTADAFMRSYLRTPTDATARLVFADWLEETGTDANVVWAHYIRAKIEADRHDRGTPERKAFEDQAATFAPKVRANLTIPAKLFVDFPKSLLQLLPAPNITVELDAFEFHQPIWEMVPESVTRENLVIPIDLQGWVLFIAAADPRNDETIQKLEFILNRDVVAVGANLDKIQSAINATYGQTEIESIDSVLYESPLIGLEDHGSVSNSLFGIFQTTFSRGGNGIVMMMTPRRCEARCLRFEDVLLTEQIPREVFTRLLAHLLSLEPTAEYRERGVHCRDLNLPLLSGRPCPVTLERLDERTERPDWFLLRFRW
jgi:uncharacterized protein (TIGR02996 family)